MKSLAALTIAVALTTAAHATQTINTRYCDLFQDPDFKGEWRRLQDGGKADLKNNKKWNDAISSITVGETCVIELWMDPGYRGRHTAAESGRYANLKAWNDTISSLTCTCNVKG